VPDASARVLIVRAGPVFEVRLDRPAVRNAFDAQTIAELARAMEAAAGDESARVVVLSGSGDVFSAGADLSWMKEAATYTYEENVADARRLAAMLAAVRDCPKPVVARVQGAAMGGGAGLVAAADLAVATVDARFAFSEVRLGLMPAVIAPFVVPRIGHAAARELFLTGEVIDAGRALDVGLVQHVVPHAELDAQVAERVDALLAGAPGAQAAVKRLLRELSATEGDPTELTSIAIAERRVSDEAQEGMTAFLERRNPPWRPEQPS
jgi:methylglutaconyl-CoA hydratase